MKKLLLLIPVFMVFTGFSQRETKKGNLMIQNQMGIDATNFIKAFLSLSSSSPSQTANVPVFTWQYKCLVSGIVLPETYKFGLRAGLKFINNDNRNETPPTYYKSKTIDNTGRIGLEVQQELTSRWILYYGVDYVIGSQKSSTEQKYRVSGSGGTEVYQADETKASTKIRGYGPIFGIQFNINKHLCLFTETSLYLLTLTTNTTTAGVRTDGSTVTPILPAEKTIKQQTIALPAFLNFAIRF